MQQSTIAIIILALVMAAFLCRRIPISVTAMLGALAMVFTGILEPTDAFSALSGETILIVLFMMILGETVFQSGLASVMGRVLRKSGKNEKKLLIVLIVLSALLSSVLSNTATVAMFMALVGSLTAAGVFNISNKKSFMAIGIASTIGGLGTLIGSVVQIPVNNVLEETCGVKLGFFSLIPIWAILVAVMVVYFLAYGIKRQDKLFNGDDGAEAAVHAQAEMPEENRTKMIITAVVMLGCIVCFATNIMPLYIAAALGTCICILTGCISEKKAFSCVNWNVIITLACLTALAKGMNASGAGKLAAESFLGLVGTEQPWLIFAAVVGTCMIMTNFMSNPAVAMLIIPIALSIAQTAGINPATMAAGVMVGSTLAFGSPIGTPPVTMTMVAGYKFTDYIKVGGPLLILCYIATIVAMPLIYGL